MGRGVVWVEKRRDARGRPAEGRGAAILSDPGRPFRSDALGNSRPGSRTSLGRRGRPFTRDDPGDRRCHPQPKEQANSWRFRRSNESKKHVLVASLRFQLDGKPGKARARRKGRASAPFPTPRRHPLRLRRRRCPRGRAPPATADGRQESDSQPSKNSTLVMPPVLCQRTRGDHTEGTEGLVYRARAQRLSRRGECGPLSRGAQASSAATSARD